MLLGLMILSSIAEVVSIGAIIPFLGALTSPQTVLSSNILSPVFQLLNISSPDHLLVPLCILFGISVIIANALRFLTMVVSTRLSFSIGFDLSMAAYRKALFQPYLYHVGRNSSQTVDAIRKAGGLVFGVVLPALNLCSAFLMLIAILSALFMVNWLATLLTFGGVGIIYFFLLGWTNKRVNYHSKRISEGIAKSSQLMQEGLGGIRDVLLDGTQEYFLGLYASNDLPHRQSTGSNILIGNSPSYGVETLGVLLIITVAYILALEPKGVLSAIPVLGAIALGAQRLVPVLQKIYGSWTEIKGSKASFINAIELLNLDTISNDESNNVKVTTKFNHAIKLVDVSFKYNENGPYVLDGINLVIPRGACVGFIGKTGSGKSTLLDLIMGLLSPTNGFIAVDENTIDDKNIRGWQSRIAHVPQHVFLADSTVIDNIAFGVPAQKVDLERVKKCAAQAQLVSEIERMPKGFETYIGEGGKALSGGQRQRIGLARALYKNADVLILDEATSALDIATEHSVMQAIKDLSLQNGDNQITILIIAHRLSTLSSCSTIVELEAGMIKRVGKFDEIITN
jgi:ABC-type multidrug transport system fused ATPase/permease subunit